MEALLHDSGFSRLTRADTFFWVVDLYVRTRQTEAHRAATVRPMAGGFHGG